MYVHKWQTNIKTISVEYCKKDELGIWTTRTSRVPVSCMRRSNREKSRTSDSFISWPLHIVNSTGISSGLISLYWSANFPPGHHPNLTSPVRPKGPIRAQLNPVSFLRQQQPRVMDEPLTSLWVPSERPARCITSLTTTPAVPLQPNSSCWAFQI